MDYPKAFVDAFKFSMRYEVGPNFNMNDPDVISGKCSDKTSKLKVGYTCIAEDAGGETKFGIAKNANPDVDVKNLTLDRAMEVYYARYWQPLSCSEFEPIVAINLFDAAINHGKGTAANFLQEAVGISLKTGHIGPLTIKAAKTYKSRDICDIILKSREALFKSIVANRPDQVKFLKGWLNRIADIRAYVASIK